MLKRHPLSASNIMKWHKKLVNIFAVENVEKVRMFWVHG
jgi:hypothetical protein